MKRLALIALVLGLVAALPSSAQEAGFDVQAFRPLGAPQDLVTVGQSRPLSHLSVSGGAFLHFALEPLVLVTQGTHSKALSVVGSRLQLDVMASVGLLDWLEVGVGMPLVLAQDSDNLEAIGTEGFIQSFVPGDLRLTTKLAVPGLRRTAEGSGLGAALVFGMGLPTGVQEAFSSDGAVTWTPGLVMDYRFASGLLLSFNGGLWLRPARQFAGIQWGNSATAGLAAELPVLRSHGITALGTLTASSPLDTLPQLQQLPAEFLLGLRWYSTTGLTFTVGGGGGCGCSLTAPTLRFFSSLIWVPGKTNEWAALERFKRPSKPLPSPPPPVDPDGDGIIDEADHCPDLPGPVANSGCPDTDRDGDGVVDRLDRCPDHPAGSTGRDGCPLARIQGNKILILEQVHFATDQDVILPESFPILEEVARMLLDNPGIQRILVEGHTDARSTAAYNLELSHRRAASVMTFLLEEGVATERVCSTGFGRSQPLARNDTEEGMALNRRVDFTIQPPVQGPLPPCPPGPALEKGSRKRNR
jgi:OmpA-OmpF porin, OOP family